MALVSLVTLPLTALLTRFISRHTRVGFQQQQAALGVLNGVIEETITGLPVIKSMGREDSAIAQFNEANAELRKAATTAQAYSSVMGPMSNLINNIGLAVVVGAGGYLTLSGFATIGTIASFVSYARQFGRPINMIAQLYNNVQSALAGAERVFQIMDEPPEVEDKPGAPMLSNVQGMWSLTMYTFPTSRACQCSSTLTFTPSPARPSPWWVPPAPARPPWSTC